MTTASLRLTITFLAVLAICASGFGQAALEPEITAEVEAFVPKGHIALATASSDLNGDGLADHLLVTENTIAVEDEHARSLLVLTRSVKGGLQIAARNDRVVYCRECGGIMGDPFQGLRAEPKEFTVVHYGGSAWRWYNEYTFRWSRRDKAWQLVRVEGGSFHAMAPDDVKRIVERPPRDFGKIDFTEFDPQDYQGKGKK